MSLSEQTALSNTLPEKSQAALRVITLTEAAAKHLQNALSSSGQTGIRLWVTSGGCSGLEYQMEPASEAQADDLTQEEKGVRFFIDPKAVVYLLGIQIDYSNALLDGGIKFTNPNAKSTCGCGTSFGV